MSGGSGSEDSTPRSNQSSGADSLAAQLQDEADKKEGEATTERDELSSTRQLNQTTEEGLTSMATETVEIITDKKATGPMKL
jgi:hypothetical protein